MGIAFLHYVTDHSYFPPGGNTTGGPNFTAAGAPAVGKYQKGGWAYVILPYMDGENVYRGGGGSSPSECSKNVVKAANPVFFCPTRRQPMVITYSAPPSPEGFLTDMGLSTSAHIPAALMDYAASNNNNEDDHPGTGIVQLTYEPDNAPADKKYWSNIVRRRDIANGLSNTLMVGEKRLNLGEMGQQQQDDNQGYSVGFDQDTLRHTTAAS